jgi:hypothetical protein
MVLGRHAGRSAVADVGPCGSGAGVLDEDLAEQVGDEQVLRARPSTTGSLQQPVEFAQ